MPVYVALWSTDKLCFAYKAFTYNKLQLNTFAWEAALKDVISWKRVLDNEMLDFKLMKQYKETSGQEDEVFLSNETIVVWATLT